KSLLRMENRNTGQLGAASVWLNHTCRSGGWTFFQSGAATDHESWTILGVGNRLGIIPMTVGCIVISLGMLYSFYVKPVLKSRLKAKYARQAALNGHS